MYGIRIKKELLSLMFSQTLLSSIALLINIIIIDIAFWNIANFSMLFIWSLIMIILLISRAYKVSLYLKKPFKYSLQATENLFKIYTILMVIVFSIGMVVLLPKELPFHQAFLSMIVAGLASGAVMSLSFDKNLIRNYLLILIVPFAIVIYMQDTQVHKLLSLLIALFLFMLIVFSRKYHSNIVDVIKSKRSMEESQEELKEQKETFETIYNGSKDAIAILDMQSNFLDVNPSYIELSGMKKDELLATSCLALTALKDIESSKVAMQEVVKVGFIKNFEKDCIIHDGKYLTVNMSMSQLHNPDRILISVRDVTELRNKEKELKHILDTTMECVIILQDGFVIDANQQTLKTFGYENLDEILGLTPLDMLMDDSKKLAMEKYKLDEAQPYQANGMKKDGTGFAALIHGKNLVLGDKTIRVSTILDISELKRTELALKLAKVKAEESTRAKSEFLANMSHEIRTPMNSIVGMIYLVKQTNLDKKQIDYLNKIEISSTNLLNIINDILDFSKIEAGKFELEKINFNMYDVIEYMRNIVEFKAYEKDLKFEIHSLEKDLIFYGDPLRVGQILINLTSNAIKFTSSGEVELFISSLDDNIIRFEVKDSGIGISKSQQEKLFESFSQADGSTTRKYGGTGLGLSISKQLIELMNGKIWIESEVDVGSSFIFEIPLRKGNKQKVQHLIAHNSLKELQLEIAKLKGSKILLVEDNSMNVEIITSLLEDSSIIIDSACNGKEALEKYKKGNYELIFMDIQMPIMDGYKATKLIREIDSEIPIIALSANVMKEDINKTKNAGMNEHLNKPVDVEKLYEILLKYISPKNIKIDVKSVKDDEIQIPEFVNIDIDIGLSHMAGNRELYLKILKDFYDNYKEIKLEEFSSDKFKIAVHTIKGLSANIGATNLHKIAKELDSTQDKIFLVEFYKQLKLVTDELAKQKINSIKIRTLNKAKISNMQRTKLFAKLKKAIEDKAITSCDDVIAEFYRYKLSSSDEQTLQTLKTAFNEFDFDKALSIIELM